MNDDEFEKSLLELKKLQMFINEINILEKKNPFTSACIGNISEFL